jgi:uncharacterized membrane protein
VLLAATIVLLGGFLYLRNHGGELPHYNLFHGEPTALRDIPVIVRDAAALQERSLIEIGLLVLIATPVMRVAFSVYAFSRQKDFTYVLITLVVLSLLLYGIVAG